MKRIFTLTLLTLIFAYSYSQPGSGYLSLSIGPAFPVGNFASVKYNNNNSGFANAGNTIDLSFNYKISENLGIATTLRTTSNTINQAGFERVNSTLYPGANFTMLSSAFKTDAFMAGFYCSYPLHKNVFFDTRLLIGIAYVTSPSFHFQESAGDTVITSSQTSKSSVAFAYLIEAGLKYNISNRISVLAGIDYFGTNPYFRNVKNSTTNPVTNSSSSFGQNIGLLDLKIGIVYRFYELPLPHKHIDETIIEHNVHFL